jgi:hypothetical protein
LNTGGHANASGLGQTFETSRDVHAVTENVAVLNNDIADVDPYSKFNAFLGGDSGVTLGHGVLNLTRTPQGIDDTGELDQQAVPGSFDDAASILGDRRVDYFGADRP